MIHKAEDRLQKIIARAGVSSRRAAEELILAGRVRVNGHIARELGTKADPYKDRIEVDGTRLVAEDAHYIVLHKPRNVVSTLRDPEGRPTVGEYFRGLGARVYPVGRLDFATSGVLLMTNDGDFANALLHPRGGVPKTYVLKVQGRMSDEDLEPWRKGIILEDGPTLPANARMIRHEGDKTWIEVTLREGRNQQIRRMGDATGWRVMRLARTSFASVTSEGLRPGEWRPLGRDEMLAIRADFGVPKRIRAAAAPAPQHGTARPWSGDRRERAPRELERVEGRLRKRGEPAKPGAPTKPGAPVRAAAQGASRGPAVGNGRATTRDAGARPARPDARSVRTVRSETTPRGAEPRGPRARGRGGR